MTAEETKPSASMKTLRSEWLFSLHLDIDYARAQKIGPAPIGWRGVYPVHGGRFEGPRMRGEVLPNGADWVTRRSDGVTLLDVRLGLLTHDGATIGMTYPGILRVAEGAAERFRRAEPVDYSETYVRTTPRFETGDSRYQWLNGIVSVANGGPPGSSPTYEVFEIL